MSWKDSYVSLLQDAVSLGFDIACNRRVKTRAIKTVKQAVRVSHGLYGENSITIKEACEAMDLNIDQLFPAKEATK